MDDVKDTLWKWFVQISALLGLCCSIYAAYLCASLLVSLPRTPPRGAPELPPEVLRMIRAGVLASGLLLGPMLGTVWLRMMLMRKWAAWVICALGAWATLTSMAFLPRFIAMSMHMASAPGSNQTIGYLWRAIVLAYVVALGCALILRPKIWRDSL